MVAVLLILNKVRLESYQILVLIGRRYVIFECDFIPAFVEYFACV